MGVRWNEKRKGEAFPSTNSVCVSLNFSFPSTTQILEKFRPPKTAQSFWRDYNSEFDQYLKSASFGILKFLELGSVVSEILLGGFMEGKENVIKDKKMQ